MSTTTDDMIERHVVTAMITSSDFLHRIRNRYNARLIRSDAARWIAECCVEYYDKYSKAPGRQIESIFYVKSKTDQRRDLMEEIEQDILPSLSDEYEQDELNVDYMVEQTVNYFTEQSLLQYSDEIRALIENGELIEAENTAVNYTMPPRNDNLWIDLSEPDVLENIENAFSKDKEQLIHFPGALGEFWNDQFTRGSFVALMAPEKRGKCLPGDQKILTSNGELIAVSEIIKQKRTDIISFDEGNRKFIKSSIVKFWMNGIKDVYQVTTRTGRRVQITKNHPFLTPDGWQDLYTIKKFNYIAVPKNIDVFGSYELSNYEIKLLAYFITEGCLRQYSNSTKIVGFTSSDKEIQKDFNICISEMDCLAVWNGINARVINSKYNRGKHDKNYVRQMLIDLGLFNKLSYE